MQQELPAVRVAKPGDEEAVIAMCRHLHEENGLFPLSENKVRRIVHRSFEVMRAAAKGVNFKLSGIEVEIDGQRELIPPSIVGVIGPEGSPLEGTIGIQISTPYYSDHWCLTELWNFVEPQYRKSRNAVALIEYAKARSRDMNVPLLVGVTAGNRMAQKTRLYRQLLGKPVAVSFAYNADWQFDEADDHAGLKDQLREIAHKCSTKPRDVSYQMLQNKVAPVLREAIRALSQESLWDEPRTDGARAA